MTENLRCPACGEPMLAAPIGQRAFACTGCGGVWAGSEAAERIEAVADAELVDLADLAASRAEARELAEGNRNCPECGCTLARRKRAKTWLDVCGAHGTWFDRGELQRVSDIYEKGRPKKEPRADAAPPPSTKGGGFDASALEGVAVVAELALNVLAAIF